MSFYRHRQPRRVRPKLVRLNHTAEARAQWRYDRYSFKNLKARDVAVILRPLLVQLFVNTPFELDCETDVPHSEKPHSYVEVRWTPGPSEDQVNKLIALALAFKKYEYQSEEAEELEVGPISNQWQDAQNRAFAQIAATYQPQIDAVRNRYTAERKAKRDELLATAAQCSMPMRALT
jgi:hypothetical protein